MGREIEAKIKVAELSALHSRLLALGAEDKGAAFERNTVFDDAEGSLERRGILLRLRQLDGAAGGLLTVKRKIAGGGGAFKTREEVESRVDSADGLRRQFAILGYHVSWIYEKRRRTLLWRDCVVSLDECPEIGTFIEIEGDESGILDVCSALGLEPASHIQNNYLGLWREHLDALGDEPRHMLFQT